MALGTDADIKLLFGVSTSAMDGGDSESLIRSQLTEIIGAINSKPLEIEIKLSDSSVESIRSELSTIFSAIAPKENLIIKGDFKTLIDGARTVDADLTKTETLLQSIDSWLGNISADMLTLQDAIKAIVNSLPKAGSELSEMAGDGSGVISSLTEQLRELLDITTQISNKDFNINFSYSAGGKNAVEGLETYRKYAFELADTLRDVYDRIVAVYDYSPRGTQIKQDALNFVQLYGAEKWMESVGKYKSVPEISGLISQLEGLFELFKKIQGEAAGTTMAQILDIPDEYIGKIESSKTALLELKKVQKNTEDQFKNLAGIKDGDTKDTPRVDTTGQTVDEKLKNTFEATEASLEALRHKIESTFDFTDLTLDDTKINEFINKIEESFNSLKEKIKESFTVGAGQDQDIDFSQYIEQIKQLRAEVDELRNRTRQNNDVPDQAERTSRSAQKEINRIKQAYALLDRYRKATGWTAAKGGESAGAYNEIVKSYNDFNVLVKQYEEGGISLEKLLSATRKYTSDLSKNSRVIKDAGENTKSLTDKVKGLAEKFGNWLSITNIITTSIRYIRQMAQASIELESAFAQLKIVTGATDSELEKFVDTSVNLATKLGQSVTDITKSIETFSRLGYNLADASKLAEYATIMSNVGAVDVESATTGLTSIVKGYNMDVSDVGHVADVLVQVGQKYAVSASELMEAYEKSGAALNATNTSFEKSAGLIAAANASVQNSGIVGTALKTVSARIRGSKTELAELGEDTEELAQGFSKYSAEIKALTGFNIMQEGSSTQFKDLFDIFEGISKGWDKLSDTQKSRVSEILGGTRQLQVISSILGNWDDAVNAYADAMNAAGTATRANDIYMETTAAHINQMKAAFQNLSMDFMDSDSMRLAVDSARGLINALDLLVTKLGGIKTVIAGVGFVTLYKNIDSILNSAKKLKSLTAISKVLDNGFFGSIAKGGKKLAEFSKAAKDAFNAASNGKSRIRLLSNAFETLGVTISTAQIYLLAFTAVIVSAIALYKVLKSSIERTSKAADDAKQAYEEQRDKVSSLRDELNSLNDQIKDIQSRGKLTLTDQKDLERLKAQTKLLEYQLQIEKKREEDKKGNQAETAYADLTTTQHKNAGESIAHFLNGSPIDGYFRPRLKTDRAAGLRAEIEEIDETLAGLYKEQASGEGHVGIESEIKYFLREKQKLEDEYDALISDISELYYAIVNENGDPIKPEYKAAAEAAKGVLDAYLGEDKAFNDLVNKNLAGQKIPETVQEFEQLKEEILDNAKAEGLFAENSEAAENSLDDILSKIPGFEKFYTVLNPSYDYGDLNSFVASVKKVSSGFEQIDKAYADVKDGGYFDWTKIVDNKDFEEAFGGYKEQYQSLVKAIAESPDDITKSQKAFNELVTAYIKGSGILKGLNEENKGYITSYLKSVGITNASEFIETYYNNVEKLKAAIYSISTDSEASAFFKNQANEYNELINIIQNSPNDIEAWSKSLYNLVTAYLDTAAASDGLTEANKKTIVTMLESVGVTDAAAKVDQYLAFQKEKAELATLGLAGATQEEIKQILSERTVTDVTRAAIASLALEKINLNRTQISTKSDIEQIISLANAAGASAAQLMQLKKAEEQLSIYSPQTKSTQTSKDHPNEIYDPLTDTYSLIPALNGRTVAAAKNAEKTISKIVTDIRDQWIDLKAEDFYTELADLPDLNYTGAGSTNDKSNSNSKSEWEEYKRHKHLVALERETQQSFIDWLDGAYTKAYRDGIITLDDMWKYEEEVFEGRKALFDDWVKDNEFVISGLEYDQGDSLKNAQKILDVDAKIVNGVEAQIAAARQRGLKDTDEYIQTLLGKLRDTNKNIDTLRKEIFDDILNDLEHRISVLQFDQGDGYKNAAQIKKIYADLIAEVDKMLSEQRAKGLGDNDTYIQQLVDKLQGYKKEIDEIDKSLFDDAIHDKEHQISLLEHDQHETTKNAKKIISIYHDMIKDVQSEMDRARKKGIDVNDSYFQDLQSKLNDYKDAIEDTINRILEKRIADFEYSISTIESGERGTNKFASGKIKLWKKEIDAYDEAINQMRAEGLNESDPRLQKILLAREELTNKILDLQESIAEAARDNFDKIVDYQKDILRKQYENEKDSQNKRLDALKEFYDKQKKMLQDQFDEEDYLKEQAEKRKTVTDIKRELDSISRDDSAMAQKRRIELHQQLTDAETELNDFERDKARDTVLNMLDDMYNAQEKEINAEIEAIDKILNDPNTIFNKAIESVKSHAENMDAVLTSMYLYNRTYGTGNDEDVNKTWGEWFTAADEYQRAFGEPYEGLNILRHPTKEDADKLYRHLRYGEELSSLDRKYYDFYHDGKIDQKDLNMLVDEMGSDLDEEFVNMIRMWTTSISNTINDALSRFFKIGYASGTESATPGVHELFENGDEYVFQSANGVKYKMFSGGEKVLNAKATDFLYKFANSGGDIVRKMIDSVSDKLGSSALRKVDITQNLRTGDINIYGNTDRATVSELRRVQRENINDVLRSINKLHSY